MGQATKARVYQGQRRYNYGDPNRATYNDNLADDIIRIKKHPLSTAIMIANPKLARVEKKDTKEDTKKRVAPAPAVVNAEPIKIAAEDDQKLPPTVM